MGTYVLFLKQCLTLTGLSVHMLV